MYLEEITAGIRIRETKLLIQIIYTNIISPLNHVFKIIYMILYIYILIIMTTDFTNQQQISNIICMWYQ